MHSLLEVKFLMFFSLVWETLPRRTVELALKVCAVLTFFAPMKFCETVKPCFFVCRNTTNMANTKTIRDLEKQLEQLKQELSGSAERIPVSQACKELLAYCDANSSSDYFTAKPNEKPPNPFKEKGPPCILV